MNIRTPTENHVPLKTYSHNSAHATSSCLSEIPFVCSYQFMSPLALFPGKQILGVMLDLKIYLSLHLFGW